MNWLKAFWQKLTAPPSAARKIYKSPSVPWHPSSASAPSSPPNTPITAIRKAWRCDPRDLKDPLSNFSPRAQQVIALARKEADRFNHNFVGTEHLLLGITALGQGVAAEVLMTMGIDLGLVRNEVERQVGTGPDQKMIGHIPYTPRVKKVLALAAKEAKALKDLYLGTEHILLGLLREGDGVAARVLKNLDVDIEKTRAEILKRRETSGTAPEQSDSVPAASPTLPPLVNFTPRAQSALTMAREDATQRKQPLLGTEHILLGLAKLGQGVAVTVLAKLGLNPETIATQIDKLGERPAAEKSEEGPFYTEVSEALKSAAEFARELNHTYIGTEHILLGLLHQTNGGAAQIFKNLNIDAKEVSEDILDELTPTIVLPKTPAMQPNPSPTKPPREPVDTTRRYDVYCVERNQKVVVYRNVRFKSGKSLFPRNDHDQWSDFVELEQSDGQTFFISKSTIVRFCPPGVKPDVENL
jgi:ATP-dependent Clp protease ATP-binding subunit ClpA